MIEQNVVIEALGCFFVLQNFNVFLTHVFRYSIVSYGLMLQSKKHLRGLTKCDVN